MGVNVFVMAKPTSVTVPAIEAGISGSESQIAKWHMALNRSRRCDRPVIDGPRVAVCWLESHVPRSPLGYCLDYE